jgi:hypothetical protein
LIRRHIRNLLGDVLVGSIDYLRFPELGVAWGGPFNGQCARQKLFRELIAKIAPAAIIETGTYRGTTTEFMAETGIPFYSVEGLPRNYGFSRARLWRKGNVHLYLGDSRAVLRYLFAGRLRSVCERPVFAYLDAHWDEDLPLEEELEIIYDNCSAAVVMIDDFKVPNDSGYQYDDYGPGKSLSPAYIDHVLSKYCLEAYYPSTPSSKETGARRGCVVLGRRQIHGDSLSALPLLRRDDKDTNVVTGQESLQTKCAATA